MLTLLCANVFVFRVWMFFRVSVSKCIFMCIFIRCVNVILLINIFIKFNIKLLNFSAFTGFRLTAVVWM